MELREEQKQAHAGVKNTFQRSNKAIVVQPTGTGKTYVALKLFEEYKDKKILFVAPTKAILWELQNTISREYGVHPKDYKLVFPDLELIIYQKLNENIRENPNYIESFNSDLVVFDEAHHLGQNKWGERVRALMDANVATKYLGFTATPVRMDGDDVSKTFFDGNVAYEMSLEEAIAKDILKMPHYVSSIYSYAKVILEAEEELEQIKETAPQLYDMLKKDLETARNRLETVGGLSEIFAKNMLKKDGKCLVFCKDISHLKEMVTQATEEGWFKRINENVEILQMHSEEPSETNDKILKRFRETHTATNGCFRVLFTVGMADEGVHIEGLDYEVMLRPTKSKRLFTQQLGRVMSISEGEKVVIDIVDNIDSFEDIFIFIDRIVKIRKEIHPELTEEEIRKEFYVTDETRDARELLNKIREETDVEWYKSYEQSVKWRESHDGKGPRGRSQDFEKTIYLWERKQARSILNKYKGVSEDEIPNNIKEKIKRLKKLGLSENIQKRYGASEWFEKWVECTMKDKITPSKDSADEEKRKIARNFEAVFLKKARQDPETYADMLLEYTRIYNLYGRRKDDKKPEEHLEIWKQWIEEHGEAPSEFSHTDDNEIKIAKNMKDAIASMRDKPKKYAKKIEEYEDLLKKFGRGKDRQDVKELFTNWKNFVMKNKKTPRTTSKNESERNLAKNMSSAIGNLRASGKLPEIVEEYDKLYAEFGRYKTPSYWLERWIQWVCENNRLPSDSKTDEEGNLAMNARASADRIENDYTDEEAPLLKRYYELCMKYRNSRLTPLLAEKIKKIEEVQKLKEEAERLRQTEMPNCPGGGEEVIQ